MIEHNKCETCNAFVEDVPLCTQCRELDLYERAVILATKAHEGQTRWGGEPYITHPLAVASQFDNDFLRAIAVMHDVLEDTSITEAQLRSRFPKLVVDSLVLLTHQENESYANYIRRIGESGNIAARLVKQADLRHNSHDLTDKKHLQRRDKYELAMELLFACSRPKT